MNASLRHSSVRRPARHRLGATLLALLVCLPAALAAQEAGLAGHWLINEKLSDDTDRRVEDALRASGQKVQRRLFDRSKDRYRGGPEEHALYDHMSYDRSLHIELGDSEHTFTYDEDFVRPVYTDNRSRSASLSGLDEVRDFSFGHWQGETLEIEARPRDGGFTEETYRLQAGGQQLRVELYIQPSSFSAPIQLLRIYDRQGG